MTHVHGKSRAIETGISRPTENLYERREENQVFERKVQHWIDRLNHCDRTSIGSYELKSQVFVEMINLVKKGDESQEVVETVVRRMPLKISLNMALKKLGEI